MINLPVATYKSTSLRSFCDITEKHLRCLRLLRQDDNQMQILPMLKSKLPRNALLELEKMKPENEEWTVKLLRHINIQMKLFHKPDESLKPPYTSRHPPPAEQAR